LDYFKGIVQPSLLKGSKEVKILLPANQLSALKYLSKERGTTFDFMARVAIAHGLGKLTEGTVLEQVE